MKEPKKMEAMKILKDLKENSIIINNRNPNDNDQVQINGLFKKESRNNVYSTKMIY